MRTKIGKRIGPVPIVAVAALALAAFLSVGLLTLTPTTPNGVPTAEAQGFTEDTTPLAGKKCEASVLTGDDGVNDGPCNTTADQLDVTVFRQANPTDNTNGAAGYRVYVTGGTEFPKVWASTATNHSDNSQTVAAANRLGKMGVDQHEVEFEATTFAKRQEQKFTVTRSMADGEGEVYLFVYSANTDSSNGTLAAASTSLAGDADVVIRVKFVGKPVFGVDSACDTDKTVDNNGNAPAPASNPEGCPLTGITTEIRSQVSATSDGSSTVTGTNTDGKAASHPELALTADDQVQVTVTATVQDAATNPLDGEVTFTVTSNPTSIAAATRIRDTNATGQATHIVDGLPTDEAYRVEVAIMFKGGTGNLDLGKVIITRAGDAATIVADTYNLMCLINDDDTESPRNYADDTFDMDNKGCATVDRFAREGMFIVAAHHEDALGNAVAVTGQPTIDLEDMDKPLDADNDGDPVTAASGTHSNGALVWLYTVEDDATLGEHDITLSTTETDVDDVVLPVTIAGPPDSYTVDPMTTHIPLQTRGTFTVTALDENGNLPALTADDPATTDKDETNNTVQIDATYGDVRGANVDGNDVLTLDLNTGEGTFNYTLPRDAKQGENFTIYVGSGTMQVEVMVTAGEMATVPATPMNVSAMANSDTQIVVTWDAVDGATSYQVEQGMMDDAGMMTWTTIAASITGTQHASNDLMAETTYYYRVTAMNSAGSSAASDGTAMATTDAAPTLDLGKPGDVKAAYLSLLGASDIQVTWTPGANAEGHYVALLSEDYSYLVEDLASVGSDVGSYKFSNVSSGTYQVGVISWRIGDDGIELGYDFADFQEVDVP